LLLRKQGPGPRANLAMSRAKAASRMASTPKGPARLDRSMFCQASGREGRLARAKHRETALIRSGPAPMSCNGQGVGQGWAPTKLCFHPPDWPQPRTGWPSQAKGPFLDGLRLQPVRVPDGLAVFCGLPAKGGLQRSLQVGTNHRTGPGIREVMAAKPPSQRGVHGAWASPFFNTRKQCFEGHQLGLCKREPGHGPKAPDHREARWRGAGPRFRTWAGLATEAPGRNQFFTWAVSLHAPGPKSACAEEADPPTAHAYPIALL